MPNLVAVELSGNHFTGPIPTFPVGAPLQQFSAANNRLTGTLEPLRYAVGLTRLDVDSNEIDGTVDQWLAERSHNMTLLSTTNNYLSCALPESTGIADSTATFKDGKLSVLVGNLFGCPVPNGVVEADSSADSYSCGSDDLTFTTIFLGVSLAATVIVVGIMYIVRHANTSPCRVTVPHPPRPVLSTNLLAGFFNPDFLTLELLIICILLASTIVLVVTLLPVYSAAPAVVECRFGWWTTAAYLVPATGNNTGWGYAVAVIGGVVVGGVGSCAFVFLGAPRGVVRVGSIVHFGALRVWRVVAVLMLCAAVFTILVAINAGFVLLEESPHASGATKDVVVLVFALLHELVDHVAGPLIVSVAVVVATGTSTADVHPSAVFVTSVAVEVVNSVLAPMIAQLGVSEGCFRDELFSSPEPVETSVDVQYCSGTGFVTEALCTLGGNQWLSYPVGVTYTPPFRFDGGRCISSIITIYTPEYLVIFALRILVYPVGWWLARHGTPWAVTGIQPPVLLRSTFVRAHSHLVRAITCCISQQSKGITNACNADSHNDVVSAPSMPSSLSSRGNAVLETLHAIEPATHRFNLLVIVAGPGMFSPSVAVAGVASLGCLNLWEWALDRKVGSAGGRDDSHDDHCQSHVLATAHAVHPMPLVCVAILQLVNTMYLVVSLSTSQLAWVGWTASAVSWLMFVVSCSWSWDSLCGTVTDHGSTSRNREHVEAPIELSELLLPPEHDAADE
jgi:hypothetical protein